MKTVRLVALFCAAAFMALTALGCTRNSRTAYDRWANDMREIDRVEDVDNRMSSYSWFYDQYNAIQAYQIQYDSDTDPDRKAAVKMILNREIAKYNSNSQKYFMAAWKGNGLPESIELIR